MPEHKKAVFITDSLYFADRRAQRSVQSLCQLGLSVTVIDQGLEPQRSGAALPAGVDYRPYPVPAGRVGRFFWHLGNHFNPLNAQRLRTEWCRRLLEKVNPDLIHVVNVFSLEAVALFAEERAVPFIYEPYEYWPEHLHSAIYGLDPALAQHLSDTEQRAAPQAAQIITVSPLLGRWYREEWGARSVSIVYSAFGQASLEQRTDKQQKPAATKQSAALKVVHSGNLAKNRNVALLVEAIGMAPGCQATIQGQGPELAALIAQVERLDLQDSVDFLAPVPIDEVIASLGGFDLGFIGTDASTRQTNGALPNKLFDYLAAGLPPIAFKTSALADFPSIDECAVLVDPATPEALAEALNKLKADPRHRAALSAGALAQRARYTDDVQREALTKVYRAVLAQAGTTARRTRPDEAGRS
ncbi:MAG: glycosyltransferase [Coriobacteriia bacterium]|nr:glycosyltransferase [Coriobacteriia bacterium]